MRVPWWSVAGRGRPPQAAARRAGLEGVEKLLTTNLTSTDTTERNASMLLPRPARRITGRAGPWLWLRVALVVVVAYVGAAMLVGAFLCKIRSA
jgi:hypothetical protein